MVVAAVVMAMVGGGIMGAGLDRRAATSRDLETSIARLRIQAEAVGRLQVELEQLDRDGRFLADRKAAHLPMVAVLDDLTRIIPDDSWLNQLEIAGTEIHLWGNSPSAGNIARRLEESKGFRRAQFRAPLTRDTQTGLQHFDIAAEIVEARRER